MPHRAEVAEIHLPSLATPRLIDALREHFGELVCDHPEGHESIAGPLRDEARFKSEEAAECTADMCSRLAASVDAWLAAQPTPVTVADIEADPIADWAAFYEHGDGTPVVVAYVEEPDVEAVVEGIPTDEPADVIGSVSTVT